MATALLIVDVQNDFCEGGALAVGGGAAVAAAITAHLHDARYDLVVASQDWHEADSTNGGHIALPPDQPDYVDSWPPHCIAGTPGAQFHPGLNRAAVDVVVRKGQGVPAYSAFQGVTDEGRALADVLAERGVDELSVCGLALDYCVRASALDAGRNGLTVHVLADLTAPVHPANATAVVAELHHAGVSV